MSKPKEEDGRSTLANVLSGQVTRDLKTDHQSSNVEVMGKLNVSLWWSIGANAQPE